MNVDRRQLEGMTRAWRSQTLRYLCTDEWTFAMTRMLEHQLPFPSRPAAWAGLDYREQALRLIGAEVRRLRSARLFAMPAAQVARVVELAADEELDFGIEPGALPGGCGFLAFETPIGVDEDGYEVVALSWGPVHPGMHPGAIVTWWSKAPSGDPSPLLFASDHHVALLPHVDCRLATPEHWLEHLRSTAYTMRASVAALRLAARYGTPPRRAGGKRSQAGKNLEVQVIDKAGAESAWLRDVVEKRSTRLREAAHPRYGAFAPGPVYQSRRVNPDLDVTPAAGHPLSGWIGVYRDVAARMDLLEQQALQRHPDLFDYLEEIRARDFGAWPAWCWMPVRAVTAALIQLYPARDKYELLYEAYGIAALGAWRAAGYNIIARSEHPDAGDRRDLAAALPNPAGADGVYGLCVLNLQPVTGPLDLAVHSALLFHLDVHEDGRPKLLLLEYPWSAEHLDGKPVNELLLEGPHVGAAGMATAEISLRPPHADGSRYTTEEVAAKISELFAFYLPELTTAFGGPGRLPIRELASLLAPGGAGRFPHRAAESPYVALWLHAPDTAA